MEEMKSHASVQGNAALYDKPANIYTLHFADTVLELRQTDGHNKKQPNSRGSKWVSSGIRRQVVVICNNRLCAASPGESHQLQLQRQSMSTSTYVLVGG